MPPHPPASADAPPRHPHGWRPTVLAITCIAVIAMQVALTGCGSTPTDTRAPAASTAIKIPTPIPEPTTPTANAGSTATASPTPFDVLANMPPAAKEHTAQGAQAFARYFFEAAAIVNQAPRSKNLTRLCSVDFGFCNDREMNTEWLTQKRYRVAGTEHLIINIQSPNPGPSDTEWTVLINFRQLPTRLIDEAGSDVDKWTSEGVARVELTVRWTNERWIAVAITKTS